jgi:hypothetical protein
LEERIMECLDTLAAESRFRAGVPAERNGLLP